jgi:hypothetical protein
MKSLSYLSIKSKFAFGIAFLSLITLFAACKKSDPVEEPVGEIRIRAVNAVSGSDDQDFYINGALKSTSSVSYGTASEYITATSGNNAVNFADEGTTTSNATAAVNIGIGADVTAFYYKTPSGQLAASVIPDDMTAPASGKARVRFINLNSFLNNTIAIGVEGSSSLIPSHPYGLLSDYFSVNPGTKFTFLGIGMTTAVTFDASITAGKIYTIWIDGETATTLTAHAIQQN